VTALSATKASFELDCRIDAFEDGKPVFGRSFRASIARDFL